jgi:hypothetical protein
MRRVKTLVLLCAMMLFGSLQANAQKFGVVGGATFSSLSGIENSSKTGWNAGATVQFKLPLGFSIQPSLMYNAKASNLDLLIGNAGLNVGYLELPVSLQWGPDLLVFRPFADVSPYVGYAMGGNSTDVHRFEYGLGVGGGIEVWRLQITCKYNWNFGPLFGAKLPASLTVVKDMLGESNFRGVTLSMAFLFGN